MMELMGKNDINDQLYMRILETESFRYFEKPKKLAFGGESHYFFDIKKLTGDPKGLHLVATILYDQINRIGGIKSVGGKETGSISIASAISYLSYTLDPQNAVHSFYVRKEKKKEGMEKQIEGCPKTPAVMVDDVITTGTTVLQAIELIRSQPIKVDYLMCIIYRGSDELATNIESKYNLKLVQIFKEKEFTEKFEREHPEVLKH